MGRIEISKKIGDTKGTFHAKMGTIKDRNGKDLTEAEEIKRWQLVEENLPANAGDVRDAGSIPGSGRFRGREHSNPLQYSSLENPMDKGAWQATWVCLKLDMTEQLSTPHTSISHTR